MGTLPEVCPAAGENALILAAARRIFFLNDPPLSTVRSLAYGVPVIAEAIKLELSQDFFRCLRRKIQRRSGMQLISDWQRKVWKDDPSTPVQFR